MHKIALELSAACSIPPDKTDRKPPPRETVADIEENPRQHRHGRHRSDHEDPPAATDHSTPGSILSGTILIPPSFASSFGPGSGISRIREMGTI